jgi:hypothetical protein
VQERGTIVTGAAEATVPAEAGRACDLEEWFRQGGIREGGWGGGQRLQMGGTVAANVAQRLGALLAGLPPPDLDEALAAGLDREEENTATLDAVPAAERETDPTRRER